MHKRITDRFCISARVYVDTMKSQLPAIGGNKCAQVFATAYHFTKVIFGKDEKGPTVANALKEFFINVGIPMQMVTDGHNSYAGREITESMSRNPREPSQRPKDIMIF